MVKLINCGSRITSPDIRMDFLKDLNEQQLKAVTAPLGPVLVLAGAGSGKTRALTYRIAYLISTKTYKANEILAVTFTNKAATEMKDRVENLLRKFNNDNDDNSNHSYNNFGRPSTSVMMGTFHSVCVRILRREINKIPPYNSNFTIFDSDDSLRAVKQILENFDIEREISPNYARSIISSIKNHQVALEAVEDQTFVEIYQSYQKLLEEVNALDFDDLLLQTVRLFQEHPRILSKYRTTWPYVLVDEYQDTNNIQYKLIKLLVTRGQTSAERGLTSISNILAVGDDAQSIYGFRGANYKNILDFEKDFPEATVVTLDENYRSTQNILNAANEVIKLSREQKEKNLWTKNTGGAKIIHHTAVDETAEGMFVAMEILKIASEKANSDEPTYELEPDFFEESETPFFDNLIRNTKYGIPNDKRIKTAPLSHELDLSNLKKIVVLYRTNAQSRALEEVFLQFGIPYHLVGAVRFYERKEIKDILSFLRLILNEKDTLSLSRAINIPPRGIGDKSFELIRMNDAGKLSTRARNSWENFSNKLASIRKTAADLSIIDIINLIVKKFDLEDYYRDGTSEGEDRWSNVRELFTVAGRFANNPWPEGLTALLEEIALYSEADEVGNKSGATLMTLHQAKGLEYETVFMVGLEEGLLPHMKSLEPGADINEEIRLAYVGMTRARKNLYLINAYGRRIFGSSYSLKPSRILRAIPEELLERRN